MKVRLFFKNYALRIAAMLMLLGAASVIGFIFLGFGLPEANVAIVYLLAVLLSTLLIPRYLFGFITSVLSAFAFDFLFMKPHFTFTVNASSYIITFVIMVVTAFITSTLVSHTKLSERRAQESEAETKALHGLTKCLTDASDIHDIAGIAVSAISGVTCGQAGCLCFDEKGMPEKTFVQQITPEKQIQRSLDNREAFLRQMKQANGGACVGEEFYDWPICGREMTLGVIRLPKETAQFLNKSQERLLFSMIESIALAMDRFRSAQQRIKLREETEQERYRSNLLHSISHDLRTPLSGILGATEMLLTMTGEEDQRYPLIEGIGNDAGWLYSLVENILSLTRLQSGKLIVDKQIEAVEEVLAGALGQISRRYPQYDIAVFAPEEPFWVPMDVKLISQVLINLLDNAVKHTQPSGEISISVMEDKTENQAVFSVKDNGSGIKEADLPHLFQMFYTSMPPHSTARPGIGLGLSICDTIVKAHGGTITAKNCGSDSGAEFTFTLPLEGE
ncbi:MAG: ATP-binding protein [Lacrimispora sp.]|uniref:sensor histidine kinase n=1 Tax=Lacrimispora sp. TaxID=2719234 RepID=UPI0039E429A2